MEQNYFECSAEDGNTDFALCSQILWRDLRVYNTKALAALSRGGVPQNNKKNMAPHKGTDVLFIDILLYFAPISMPKFTT